MSNLMDKDFMTPDDVDEGVKSEEGKRSILGWMMKQCIPHGLARLWNEMNLPELTEGQKDQACSIMWDSIMRTSIWQIMEEKKLAQQISKSGLIPSSAEELYKMHTKGEA